MSQQQHQQPTDGGMADKHGRDAPASTLELYDGIVNPSATDRVVEKLGTGYYSEDEQWQQVQSYQQGMYGDAAFGRNLWERSVLDAIFELGQNGWRFWDDHRDEYKKFDGADVDELGPRESPREAIYDRGQQIWERLEDHDLQRAAVLREYASLDEEWTPPHWRMMEARHEASKSRDARTQDNAFGTRSDKRVVREGDSDESSHRFRRSRGERR